MSHVIASVFVPGRPRTKGHIENFVTGRGSGKIRVANADREVLKVWMKVLIGTLRRELGITVGRVGGKAVRTDGEPYAGPVDVFTYFRFERQQAAGGGVWPSHDTPCPTAMDLGDEDTLRRAVLDGLTQAGVIDDDRWVVNGANAKRWCLAGEEPGVQIFVFQHDGADSARSIRQQERGWEHVVKAFREAGL